jgi:acyl-CoA thioesterase
MDKERLAIKIVEKMFEKDRFSQWLGIERIEVGQGKSVLRMIVRDEMMNGFNQLHGGVTYSLADSALAFASNAYGRLSMLIESTMSYPVAAKTGDVLETLTDELSLSNKLATYLITVYNQNHQKVGIFKGTVFRTSKEWFPEPNVQPGI